MSNTVVVTGANYTVPDPHEKSWGQNVTDLLIALAAAVPGNQGFLSVVSVASSPYTAVSGKTLLVDTSSARQINLPAPAVDAYLMIKDISGTAETNNITLHRNGSENIDGAASDATISINNSFVFIVSDGTDWYILLEI